MRLEMIRRHAGMLQRCEQGLRREIYFLGGTDNLRGKIAILRVNAIFSRLADLQSIRKETFNRSVACRRFAQDTEHLHSFVNINICDWIAVDARHDCLGEGKIPGGNKARRDKSDG